jgi:hypothetical protein
LITLDKTTTIASFVIDLLYFRSSLEEGNTSYLHHFIHALGDISDLILGSHGFSHGQDKSEKIL